MRTDEALARITDFYLKSRDFNGILITDLGKDFEVIRNTLRKLLKEEKFVLSFGDRHPNPHILAFEPEPKEEHLEKLDNLQFQELIYEEYGSLRIQRNSINCCAYPSRNHLKLAV